MKDIKGRKNGIKEELNKSQTKSGWGGAVCKTFLEKNINDPQEATLS